MQASSPGFQVDTSARPAHQIIQTLESEVYLNLEHPLSRKFQNCDSGFVYELSDDFTFFILGRSDEGEPDIEVVLPQIVMGHPGVAVDHFDEARQPLRGHLGGAQGAGIAQLAGGEIGPDAADDAAILDGLHPPHDLRLRGPYPAAHLLIRPGDDGKMGLDFVQDGLVQVV